jgi:hypothetical protein
MPSISLDFDDDIDIRSRFTGKSLLIYIILLVCQWHIILHFRAHLTHVATRLLDMSPHERSTTSSCTHSAATQARSWRLLATSTMPG